MSDQVTELAGGAQAPPAEPPAALTPDDVQKLIDERLANLPQVELAPEKPAKPKPSLASLQWQQCPRCTTGILTVDVYDPDAKYEAGQVIEAGRTRSGGSYHVSCRQCDFSESRAMDPVELDEPVRVKGGE